MVGLFAYKGQPNRVEEAPKPSPSFFLLKPFVSIIWTAASVKLGGRWKMESRDCLDAGGRDRNHTGDPSEDEGTSRLFARNLR